MRTMIALMFLALLAGCGSDDDTAFATTAQLPPNEATAVAAMRAQIQTLQGQVSKFNEIQLIGRPTASAASASAVREMAMLREPVVGAPSAATVAGQFGPCPNMGVQEGFDSVIGDALSAVSKAFKTCTGYHVEYMTADGSLKTANRIFWDGPNCTGNLLEWEAGGAGYDHETLKDGVVFVDPFDGVSVRAVTAGQTPQPILIQSVWVLSNPGCQADVETQLMYKVSSNDVQITGVPNSPVGQYTTGAP